MRVETFYSIWKHFENWEARGKVRKSENKDLGGNHNSQSLELLSKVQGKGENYFVYLCNWWRVERDPQPPIDFILFCYCWFYMSYWLWIHVYFVLIGVVVWNSCTVLCQIDAWRKNVKSVKLLLLIDVLEFSRVWT